MEITSEKNDNRLVLRASGRFDAAGARVVGDALEHALAGGSHAVELDMAGVDYLSSAGIRVLVTYYRKFSQLKGGLYLTSVSERICRLLEMTGLYGLLDSPDERGAGTATDLQTVRFDGWELTSRNLESGGSLVPRVFGPPEGMTGPEDESSPEVLAFSPTTLAFGTGALGYDATECKGRYGPFLAAAGYAAFRPREGDRDPDFEEYAEAYIPKLHVLSAIALAGNYSLQFSFESNASAPGIRDVARALLAAGGVPAAGFVLAAECEVPEGSVLSPGIRDAPAREEKPVGLTSADGSRLCLVLVGGVVGEPGSLPALPVLPGSGTDPPVLHAHAAFFPYQPLRRHGRVKLKDTADLLFDLGLLDVVALIEPGRESVTPGIRLLRGLAWTAPLQP